MGRGAYWWNAAWGEGGLSHGGVKSSGGGELGYKGDRFVGGVARGKVRGQLLREVRIISEF